MFISYLRALEEVLELLDEDLPLDLEGVLREGVLYDRVLRDDELLRTVPPEELFLTAELDLVLYVLVLVRAGAVRWLEVLLTDDLVPEFLAALEERRVRVVTRVDVDEAPLLSEELVTAVRLLTKPFG